MIENSRRGLLGYLCICGVALCHIAAHFMVHGGRGGWRWRNRSNAAIYIYIYREQGGIHINTPLSTGEKRTFWYHT